MSDHLAKSFEEELHRLRSMVVAMGNLTVEQLQTALQAIEKPESSLAARVIEREPEADRLEHQIDSLVIRILALRQPVAVDLRQALSGLESPTNLSKSAIMRRIWPSASSHYPATEASRSGRLLISAVLRRPW